MRAYLRISDISLLATMALSQMAIASNPPAKAWIREYTGPAGFYNIPHAITADGGGSVFVTGESATGTGSAWATVKYSPSGDPLWTTRYLGQPNGSDRPFSVLVDPDGNVIVAGTSDGVGTFADYAAVKYNGTTGDQMWVCRFNGDYGLQGALDAAGNLYMTGQTYNGTDYDIVTIKVNGATGELVWSRSLDGVSGGPDGINDAGISIDADAAGNSYITGWVQVAYDSNEEVNIYAIAAASYDTDGNSRWSVVLGDETLPGQGSAIKVNSGGDAFVTGGRTGGIYIARLAGNSGDVVWDADYLGPTGNGATPYAMALDPLGNPVVTGGGCAGSPFCNESFVTVEFDADSGKQRWEGVYTDSSSNAAGSSSRAIAIAHDGSVAVTGFTLFFAGRPGQSVTIEYDTDGNERWRDVYIPDGSLSANGTALAFDAFGNLLYTGNRRITGNSFYSTIKYRVCIADFDGDGFITGLDYDLFVGAFESGDMSADFDNDGFITGVDFDLFVVQFESGC